MKFIDTHTHLFLNQFEEDSLEVINRAVEAGVTKMFLPNVDTETLDDLFQLTYKFPDNCFPILGLHPSSVKNNFERDLEFIEDKIYDHRIYGIGETGIDLYWDKTTLDKQIIAFKRQISWAKKYKLPIIIHARESYNEIFEVLETENDEKLTGIFHCFTGGNEEAQKILNLKGFKLGIGGVITYKTSNLCEVIKDIDLKHIVLETDSPFLPPMPHRGKRNESLYVINVAQKIAEIKNISLQTVAEITTANALQLFKIIE